MPIDIKRVIRRRPVQQVLDDDTPLFSDDDTPTPLTAPAARTKKRAGHHVRTWCRDCRATIEIDVSAPARLCERCVGGSIHAALTRLHRTRIDLENEVAAQVQAWNAFLLAQSAGTRARYERVREATIKAIRGEISEAVLAQSLQAARNANDGLSVVLARKEEADRGTAQLSAQIDAVDAAIEEYGQLPGAAGWVMSAELEQARRNVGVFQQTDMGLNAPRATRSHIYGRE